MEYNDMESEFKEAALAKWTDLSEETIQILTTRRKELNGLFKFTDESINNFRLINSMIFSAEVRLTYALSECLSSIVTKTYNRFDEGNVQCIKFHFYAPRSHYFKDDLDGNLFKVFSLEVEDYNEIDPMEFDTDLFLTTYYSSEDVSPINKELKICKTFDKLIKSNFLSWSDILRIVEVKVDVNVSFSQLEKVGKKEVREL